MITEINVSPFRVKARELIDNYEAWSPDGDVDDDFIDIFIGHIGLFGMVISGLLIFAGACFGTLFHSRWFINVLFLILYVCLNKYIFGGFGGRSYFMSVLKLLLSIFMCINFITITEEGHFRKLVFDMSNKEQIELIFPLLLGGVTAAMTMWSFIRVSIYRLSSYRLSDDDIKWINKYAFNRAVAAFNSGIAVTFSLFLLCCQPSEFAFLTKYLTLVCQ